MRSVLHLIFSIASRNKLLLFKKNKKVPGVLAFRGCGLRGMHHHISSPRVRHAAPKKKTLYYNIIYMYSNVRNLYVNCVVLLGHITDILLIRLYIKMFAIK